MLSVTIKVAVIGDIDSSQLVLLSGIIHRNIEQNYERDNLEFTDIIWGPDMCSNEIINTYDVILCVEDIRRTSRFFELAKSMISNSNSVLICIGTQSIYQDPIRQHMVFRDETEQGRYIDKCQSISDTNNVCHPVNMGILSYITNDRNMISQIKNSGLVEVLNKLDAILDNAITHKWRTNIIDIVDKLDSTTSLDRCVRLVARYRGLITQVTSATINDYGFWDVLKKKVLSEHRIIMGSDDMMLVQVKCIKLSALFSALKDIIFYNDNVYRPIMTDIGNTIVDKLNKLDTISNCSHLEYIEIMKYFCDDKGAAYINNCVDKIKHIEEIDSLTMPYMACLLTNASNVDSGIMSDIIELFLRYCDYLREVDDTHCIRYVLLLHRLVAKFDPKNATVYMGLQLLSYRLKDVAQVILDKGKCIREILCGYDDIDMSNEVKILDVICGIE